MVCLFQERLTRILETCDSQSPLRIQTKRKHQAEKHLPKAKAGAFFIVICYNIYGFGCLPH